MDNKNSSFVSFLWEYLDPPVFGIGVAQWLGPPVLRSGDLRSDSVSAGSSHHLFRTQFIHL